jgi:hypothetical protein
MTSPKALVLGCDDGPSSNRAVSRPYGSNKLPFSGKARWQARSAPHDLPMAGRCKSAHGSTATRGSLFSRPTNSTVWSVPREFRQRRSPAFRKSQASGIDAYCRIIGTGHISSSLQDPCRLIRQVNQLSICEEITVAFRLPRHSVTRHGPPRSVGPTTRSPQLCLRGCLAGQYEFQSSGLLPACPAGESA